ncbi:Sir2 family NAD-dependent protein deacetylase [Arthrobacter sp. N199823]|uniref:Sir2 family NAD-dependent protein deacetylase n=1 Tax=Arthrobacter sp. N199823 TaxID=2058895 RepID=UPI0035BE9157
MDQLRPGIGETGFVPAMTPAVPGMTPAATSGASAAALSRDEIAAVDMVAATLGGQPFALLTGAGISTDSGIPDYRGPGAPPRNPLTYQEFMREPSLRQRYWARNHVGWSRMHLSKPNAGHFAATELERAGMLSGIVTQNVDRLHEAALASNVVDLHGRFDQVLCMECGNHYSRSFLAIILNELNPGFLEAVAAAGGVSAAPDADADVESEKLISAFNVAKCPLCGGLLKPDFVFFGENVPQDRVLRSFSMVDAAAALVVAGSSLSVLSGLRFVKKAAKDGKPVIIINRGKTRGDSLATVKLELGVSEAMTQLTRSLGL